MLALSHKYEYIVYLKKKKKKKGILPYNNNVMISFCMATVEKPMHFTEKQFNVAVP